MDIDDFKALGWYAQAHVYIDPVTGARVPFYAIHKPDGSDTGAHDDTEDGAWLELAWLIMLSGVEW